ncbi:uncharacterized protein UBRO_20086 [Ustilago bromivora]|uniref:Uncharacterized protein n=1 Tax=Ustilago bromivora TaxID=307758 RepID=A0A1K0GR68_9BASI|nr:uncharacterized protein UBRO_20086 [Ustilago bromivora]SYW81223.1 uncharacterized protein UBRO2_04140 [Ustilago bromivora]
MWRRSPAAYTYWRQYQEELKRLNFLTGAAVWRDHNQRFKACLTPEVYQEYKLVVGQKHQATKTVEELQARHRKYYREREARASDPDHYKALKEGQQQRHLEQWKADKEYNEEIKMRRKERSCCYWEKNKEEVCARRRAKYQEQKKDPALMERKRQRDCEWHRKKAKALSKPPPLAPSTLPSPDRSGSDTCSSDEREPPPSQQAPVPSSDLSNDPDSNNNEENDSNPIITPFWQAQHLCEH